MKKSIKRLTAIVLVSTIISAMCSVSVFAYNGEKAASYANSYATSPNKYYRYFENGDCTNFVSQCLKNGGLSMSNTSNKSLGINNESNAWYHQKYHVKQYLFGWCFNEYDDWKISTTWIRVSHESNGGAGLYQYLINRSFVDDYGSSNVKNIIKQAKVGDIIQCSSGASKPSTHSVIVTAKSSNNLTIAYHTNNKKNVSFKSFAKNYKYFHLLKIAH